MGVLFIKPGLVIADNELSERFIHASGPAGRMSTRWPAPSS